MGALSPTSLAAKGPRGAAREAAGSTVLSATTRAAVFRSATPAPPQGAAGALLLGSRSSSGTARPGRSPSQHGGAGMGCGVAPASAWPTQSAEGPHLRACALPGPSVPAFVFQISSLQVMTFLGLPATCRSAGFAQKVGAGSPRSPFCRKRRAPWSPETLMSRAGCQRR